MTRSSSYPHKKDLTLHNRPNKSVDKVLHSPYFSLTVAYLIWGIAAPISKLTLGEIGPFSLLFFRTIITAGILLPFILKHKIALTLHEQWNIALSGFFSIFLHITLIYTALPLIPSINLPIISSMSPFIFVLLARVFLREKVGMNKYYGMALGLLGVLCITLLPVIFPKPGEVLGISTQILSSLKMLGLENANLPTTTISWIGNGLLILAIVIGSIGSLFIKPIRHLPGRLITFWQFAIVACISLPLALLENPDLFVSQISLSGMLGIGYIALFSSVVAYSLYNSGLQETKAADVGLFSYISPLAALMVGIPLLHEYPDLWFIIGAGLVLVGVLIAERKTRNKFVHSAQTLIADSRPKRRRKRTALD
ncbi:DMT family transporter [Candidatus Woesebacteria bacterium]|nr:DMT family transporter [Candidatus Woesebacteria bacterium]